MIGTRTIVDWSRNKKYHTGAGIRNEKGKESLDCSRNKSHMIRV